MHRYRATIEYDGTAYCGWQRQSGQPSIQQALEEAATGFLKEQPKFRGAGRTDAGVHAAGQVAHFDVSDLWDGDRLCAAFNAHLRMHGHTIAMLDASPVPESFDARFSAIRRHYRYRIVNRRAPLTFDRFTAWQVSRQLDTDAMNEAARHLIGKHDFTTFRSVHCQSKSPVKTLELLDVTRLGQVLEIRAAARSFLHNQIRSIAGTLVKVGDGSWTARRVREVLEAADRAACGPVAPPQGLCLMRVDYD